METEFLNELRYWFQRVLVPCIVIIGVAGNLITVIVLTRRRMRCSTNVYLTALAVADLAYLLFVFILSLEHYPNIHRIKYELYWRLYGISHWFADATSYTSIWLTVSFTIERYIAVCHPIRGKVLCTESRAKRVIAVVAVLCFLTTGTTSFEYLLTSKIHIEPRISSIIVSNNITEVTDMPMNCTIFEMNNTYLGNYNTNVTWNMSNPYCTEESYLYVVPSPLGNNSTYRTVFYWFTSVVFVLLPLILLATFNCFLVAAVHSSHKQRGKMTNQQADSTQNQENKITVILIAVVLLFLVCQTPMAVFLIYTSWPGEALDEAGENVLRALGNVFNMLVHLNAACNFLLYCALSDKYRRTFKALFLRRNPTRQNTWGTTRMSKLSQTTSLDQSNGLKRNTSECTRNKTGQNINQTNAMLRQTQANKTKK